MRRNLFLVAIGITLDRLISPSLLVVLVTAAKIHFEKQVQVAGTKQRSQADKAVRHACFVLCPLLAN